MIQTSILRGMKLFYTTEFKQYEYINNDLNEPTQR